MGSTTRDEGALKADKTTPYTVLGYKFSELGAVFLTTTDPSNPHHSKLTRVELAALKTWLNAGARGVFASDSIFIHASGSLAGTVHIKDGATGGHMFTYVPMSFLHKL